MYLKLIWKILKYKDIAKAKSEIIYNVAKRWNNYNK